MASLSTEIQNRFSAQILINFSNPQLTSGGTLDTTRLNNAIADTVTLFVIYAGEAVDSSAPTAGQIAAATPCIVELLQVYSGQLSYEAVEKSIRTRLENYAMVNSRDRMAMSTDSTKTKTADATNELVAFDWTKFRGYVPTSPSVPPGQD